jgi:hypothetical protein
MKYRRLIAAALIPATLSLAMGCMPTSTFKVPTSELEPAEGERQAEAVRGVVTLSGEEVRFDDPVLPATDTLHATVKGEPYSIALNQVDKVMVKRKDTTKLVLQVVTVVLVVAATVVYYACCYEIGYGGGE